MPILRCACLAFLIGGLSVGANAQTKHFPTDDEINLVLTQTERAMEQYKSLIDRAETEIGKGYAEAAANDRHVVAGLETAVKAFKVKPEGFNGPLGFAFFEWLDDASRNAVLCASGASMESEKSLTNGDISRASDLIHLAQNCQDVSALIYTVSENAGALYQRYVEAQEELAVQGAQIATKCADILKKQSPPHK